MIECTLSNGPIEAKKQFASYDYNTFYSSTEIYTMNVYCFMAHRQLRSFSAQLNLIINDPWVNKPVLGQKTCLAQGHSTMTVVPRQGIEPGTPGFEIPDANHSTTADSYIFI